MRPILASRKGTIIYQVTIRLPYMGPLLASRKGAIIYEPILASRKNAILYKATSSQPERCYNI